jgi:MFS family permease
LRVLVTIAGALAAAQLLGSLAPTEWSFCLSLVAIGGATLLFLTSANSSVQLAADDTIRGRVMGVYLLVFIGSGALGGPLLGWFDERLGPRTGMLLAGAIPAVAVALLAAKLARDEARRLRTGSGWRAVLVAVRTS